MPLEFTGGNGPTSGFGVRANFWVLNFMSINFKTNQGSLIYEGYGDLTAGLTSYSPLYTLSIPVGYDTYSQIMGNILGEASTTAAYLHNFFDEYAKTQVTGPGASGGYEISLTGATVRDFNTGGGGGLESPP